ncbi:hypothetical protein [Pseudonocardia sp. GCM10023141]|uniref:hypothetical protein n=1 Tax=Pseudonocardia sp. GCM10023141 TaxID=3252653 RepID=UPI00360A032E
MRAQGIDPDAAGLDRGIVIALMDERRGANHPGAPVAQVVQPQARRKARRALLAERTKSVGRPTASRADWTIEEIDDAMNHLDDIGDKVEAASPRR